MKKHFHCPVNGWDCPYFKNEGCICTLKDPMADCDDFAFAWAGANEEDCTDFDE